MNKITLGQYLKRIRKTELILTETEMAQRIGISRPYYNQIENGKVKSLSATTIKKIANAVNKEPKEIYENLQSRNLQK